jgi:hypothetical protein
MSEGGAGPGGSEGRGRDSIKAGEPKLQGSALGPGPAGKGCMMLALVLGSSNMTSGRRPGTPQVLLPVLTIFSMCGCADCAPSLESTLT